MRRTAGRAAIVEDERRDWLLFEKKELTYFFQDRKIGPHPSRALRQLTTGFRAPDLLKQQDNSISSTQITKP
jgi:hypothetical protein